MVSQCSSSRTRTARSAHTQPASSDSALRPPTIQPASVQCARWARGSGNDDDRVGNPRMVVADVAPEVIRDLVLVLKVGATDDIDVLKAKGPAARAGESHLEIEQRSGGRRCYFTIQRRDVEVVGPAAIAGVIAAPPDIVEAEQELRDAHLGPD